MHWMLRLCGEEYVLELSNIARCRIKHTAILAIVELSLVEGISQSFSRNFS